MELTSCRICGHPHVDYDDEPCVSCGCDLTYIEKYLREHPEIRAAEPDLEYERDLAEFHEFRNAHRDYMARLRAKAEPVVPNEPRLRAALERFSWGKDGVGTCSWCGWIRGTVAAEAHSDECPMHDVWAALSQPVPELDVEKGRKAMEARYDDLRWCNKKDDCHLKADGARLAIEDFEDALGLEPLGHPPREAQ